MTTLLTRVRNSARNRAAYRRTLREIRTMPLDTALDLGIYKGEAKSIARRAVYGA